MIGVRIAGGIGNQMFEYAAARALALRHKTDVHLDLIQFEGVEGEDKDFRAYMLDYFNIVHVNSIQPQKFKLIKENSDRKFYPELISAPAQCYLVGFWQSEKYFEDYADVIRSELTLKIPLSEQSQTWARKIQNDPVPVSIHVRRGDYVTDEKNAKIFHQLPLEYYDHAVQILKENFSNLTLYIFSDDLNWCRRIFNYDVSMNFVDGNDEFNCYEDLELMKLCRHHIIANSSFSWWGAWLSEGIYKGSITIAPDKFFVDRDDVKKRIPDRWIILKS